MLELSHSLTPYYWLNIADSKMPFGGLIEHTNYIPRERYGGRHLVYISNYLFPDHPQFREPRGTVVDSYLPSLRRVNPEFDASWIQKVHHFRADYAQPVVTCGYRQQIPPLRTSLDRCLSGIDGADLPRGSGAELRHRVWREGRSAGHR